MLRTAAFVGALLILPALAAAQAPCTTDARHVVDEIYRHMLERPADTASGVHVEQLVAGRASVRDLVRLVAISPEHIRRFFPPGQDMAAREAAVGTLYRHLLGRQPDAAGARAFAELAARQGAGAVIDDIVGSPEYETSFGDMGVPGSGGLHYCVPDRARRQRAARAVRQNADRTAAHQVADWSEASFTSLDHNRDGRLGSNEWHGSLEAFAALDDNRDSVLT